MVRALQLPAPRHGQRSRLFSGWTPPASPRRERKWRACRPNSRTLRRFGMSVSRHSKRLSGTVATSRRISRSPMRSSPTPWVLQLRPSDGGWPPWQIYLKFRPQPSKRCQTPLAATCSDYPSLDLDAHPNLSQPPSQRRKKLMRRKRISSVNWTSRRRFRLSIILPLIRFDPHSGTRAISPERPVRIGRVAAASLTPEGSSFSRSGATRFFFSTFGPPGTVSRDRYNSSDTGSAGAEKIKVVP